MTNKFLLLIFLLFLVQSAIAQDNAKVSAALKEFNNDTAEYINQRILSRKSIYIGKSLDSLLKDLPMILRYANGDAHRNRFISPDISLYFSSSKRVMDKLALKQFPQLIVITWATPLDNREFEPRGLRFWGGDWTPAAYNYYKDKIIGDIEVVKY